MQLNGDVSASNFSLLLLGLILVGCGETTSLGADRRIDDPGSSGGSGGATSGRGSVEMDASAPDTGTVDLCGDRGAVSNVHMSSAPTEPVPAGTGGSRAAPDGGGFIAIPSDPCVTYTPPDCPGPPRWIFGCPIVEGPNRSPTVHAGDEISVKLEVSDDGLGAYSCMGVGTDSPLTGGMSLFDAVRPAYVQETGQIPPSTPPGTVMHFEAVASGSSYAPALTACSRDLTQVEFDVTVE
jgi:hypothetical protein